MPTILSNGIVMGFENLERIGKIELKNIQRPVEVYRVVRYSKSSAALAGKRRMPLSLAA